MKVKVTPTYDGAGSWTTDCVWVAGKWRDEETLVEYPASWCEPIPEVTPEYGDIVEVWDEGERSISYYVRGLKNGRIMASRNLGDSGVEWLHCRVLARKPMGGLDAHDAIGEFYRDISEADTASAEVIAYNKFLSAILGVPYARVGE